MEERLAGTSIGFYLHKPELTLTLRELEEACIKRLQLLRDVETHAEVTDGQTEKTEFPLKFKDTDAGFIRVPKDIAATAEQKMKLATQAKLSDEASHFVLKLAYCQTSERCKWFIRQEKLLFQKRLEYHFSESERNEFLRKTLGFAYERYDRMAEDCTEENDKGKVQEVQRYYKVPLHHATHLLAKGTLYPVKGFVDVPGSDLSAVVSKLFEDMLEFNLKSLLPYVKVAEEDERLSLLIRRVLNPATAPVPRSSMESKAKLSLQQLEPSTRHFPPCMKVLNAHLRKDHHLKHYGRLQFGLFLKAIGLSFEDSLKFWKTEFCQKMTPDKFHKDYEYNIRHSYGKVGKMVDYTASGCSKLAHLPLPAAQEHHGCPFRHLRSEDLAHVLLTYGLNPLELDPILEKAQTHPQVACIRLFKASHKGCPDSFIDHIGHFPAAFYEASRRLELS